MFLIYCVWNKNKENKWRRKEKEKSFMRPGFSNDEIPNARIKNSAQWDASRTYSYFSVYVNNRTIFGEFTKS